MNKLMNYGDLKSQNYLYNFCGARSAMKAEGAMKNVGSYE